MKRYRIEWSQEARNRLVVLCDFIAGKLPAGAARVIGTLLKRVRLLHEQPEIGRVYPDAPSRELRQMVFGSYRVVYLVRHAEKQVFVVTVQHGRELPASLESLMSVATSGSEDEGPAGENA